MRFVAIDLGDKRTGLAVGDLITRLATPVKVIECPINRGDGEATVSGVPAGSYKDELTGAMVEGANVSVPARSARILVKP